MVEGQILGKWWGSSKVVGLVINSGRGSKFSKMVGDHGKWQGVKISENGREHRKW